MTTLPDSATMAPSLAEARLAYIRKLLWTIVPIASAGTLVLSGAVNSGHALDGVTWWQVIVAVAAAAVTFAGSNAVVKAAGGLVAALASIVAAALTHGGISAAEYLQILLQVFAWVQASSVVNGPKPEVVASYYGTDATPDKDAPDFVSGETVAPGTTYDPRYPA